MCKIFFNIKCKYTAFLEKQINNFANESVCIMKSLKYPLPFLLLAALVLAGCGPKTPDYKKKLLVDVETLKEPLLYDRYEDVLFRLDTANFQDELKSIQQDFHPFLDGDLDNPDAVRYLKRFAVDPFVVSLYQKVKHAFPDLDEINGIVCKVYSHFHHYYPDLSLPSHVYTCVSGVDPDVPSVLFSGEALILSLDWYLDGDEVYEMMGMPQYRARRTNVAYLAKDLGKALYERFFEKDVKRNSLLEEMVYAGRIDYFIEAMCPEIADSVLLGYTSDQLHWVEENEGNLWADMVSSQCLYSTDLEVYRTFLLDGPFTNEYSHEAPSRLGEFIGLQIVRSYMGLHDITLQELLQMDDLQGAFLESRYKPKK